MFGQVLPTLLLGSDQEMELKLKAAHNDDMHSLLAQQLGPENVEQFGERFWTCIYIYVIFVSGDKG